MNAGGTGPRPRTASSRATIVALEGGRASGSWRRRRSQLSYRHSRSAPTTSSTEASYHARARRRRPPPAPASPRSCAGGASTSRRAERRLGVHEPARGLGRAPRRSGRAQGTSRRLGGGVRQARQFHPGRPRRLGRRRETAHRRGAGARCRAPRRRAAHRAAPGRIRGGAMTDPRIQARRVPRRAGTGPPPPARCCWRCWPRPGLSAGPSPCCTRSCSGPAPLSSQVRSTPREAEILKASGLVQEPPLIDVNATVMQRRLDRLPWVLASVHVAWPSTVGGRRSSSGCRWRRAALVGGGYALCDATGRVLADQSLRPSGLPLVALPGASRHPAAHSGLRRGRCWRPPRSFPCHFCPVCRR